MSPKSIFSSPSGHLICQAVAISLTSLAMICTSATAAAPSSMPRPCWFDQPLDWVGGSPPIQQETLTLQALFATLKGQAPEVQAEALETWIEANPTSGWSPSLRINLGKYFYEHTQFYKAIGHWQAAWQATQQYDRGVGKRMADYAWAHWNRLLTGLAQLEALDAMFSSLGNRTFGGPWAQMVVRSHEAYLQMKRDPAMASRCGPLALSCLAREAFGQGYDTKPLLNARANGQAFSLAALGELAQQLGLDLIPLSRAAGAEEIVVPSIVHWQQNHYAAILAQDGDYYQVADPLYGRLRWFKRSAIDAEASGYFLASSRKAPPTWRRLADAEASAVTGRSYAYMINDNVDQPCLNQRCPPGHGSGGCSPGMVHWRVSEPYINLWLEDEPVGYDPPAGDRIALQIAYKQRDEVSGADSGKFSFGAGWHANWISWVHVDDPGFPITSTTGTLYLPGGGEEHFDFSMGENFYDNNCNFTYNYYYDDLGNIIVTDFVLTYPDGTWYDYNVLLTDWSGQFTQAYLGARYCAQGNYGSQFSYYWDGMSGVLRLQSVSAVGGSYCSVNYSDPSGNNNLVASVTDPFGHTASFAYTGGSYPQIATITDVAGLTSSLAYGSGIGQPWPTSLSTPYGTTTFSYENNTYSTPLARAVYVNEPNGGRQIYAYYGVCDTIGSTPWLPAAYPSSWVPSGQSFLSFNNEPHYRESFYWNQHQTEGLPSALSSFTTNNFNRARMRHWLSDYSVRNDVTPTGTLSFERDPSPDAAGMTNGQLTWYGYAGQNNGVNYPGTQIQPQAIALILPDASVRYEYYTYNSFGWPTLKTETYGTGNPAPTRTRTYAYDGNSIDLLAEYGPENNLLVSYLYNVHRVYQKTEYYASGASYTTSWTYTDYWSRMDSMWDSSGNVVQYTYFPAASGGYLQSVADQLYRTNWFTWSNGHIRASTDARGLTVTNTWDALGRLLEVDYPDGTSLQYSYSLQPGYGFNTGGSAIPVLDQTGVKDRLGNWTWYGLDRLRRQVSVTDPLGHTTWYAYCGCGSPDLITNALGQVTTIFYDNAGRKTDIFYADGTSEHWTFNSLGQMLTSSDNLVTRTYSYNNQGLQAAVSNPYGQEQATGYNLYDQATGQTDSNGVTVSQTFDWLSRVLTRTYPDGGVEGFAYSSRGLIYYTSQLGNVTQYVYDNLRRKISETTPNNETMTYGYDLGDGLVQMIDGLSHTTTWSYNVEGLLVSKQDNNGTTNLVCTYDANQRLINRWTPAMGNTTYAYDAAGNQTNSYNAHNASAVTQQFDALNRVMNMVVGQWTTRYAYTMAGDLQSEATVSLWGNATVTYSWDANVAAFADRAEPGSAQWRLDTKLRL